MPDNTITSANSVVTFSVSGLYDSPQQLEGYAADKAWETDAVELAETMIGVDGKKSAGYTPQLVKQTFHLQADSLSKQFFIDIANATRQTRDTYRIDGTISLPSTGETFTCTNGTLTSFKPVPDAAKVLQPMDFAIVWESITPGLL